MKTKNQETIRQRIKSRLKGLAALAIAVVMVVSMMPAMETRAAETGYYYFATSYASYAGILGNGNVSVTGYDSFVYRDNDFHPAFKSGITKLGDIGTAENSAAITINPEANTTFYYGGVQSGYFRIYLDGAEKTTGYNWWSEYSSFDLPAGKYTVQHTATNKEGNNNVWKIEVNTVIESIKLSSSSLNFTIGDTSQKLTVDPSTAKVEWKTGNESVATVDNEGNVKPVGVGETEITATLTTDDNVKAACKVTVRGKEIVLTEDQKPTAKTDLKENGEAQELVNAPKAPLEGTAMNYALGKDSSTAPTEGWSTSIPTATNAGTYYVWYKAIGDESHSDSEANYVKVTIDEKTEAHTHDIKHVEAKEPTCTEDGYEAHYECTICNEWFADMTLSAPLDKTEVTKKATGHKWDDGVITQEATYDETGIKTYTCSVCGETKEEIIPVKTRRYSSSSDSSDSDSESSGGGSSGKSGSISTKSIDVNGNTVQTQPDSGAPLSDRGGNWGNQEHIWTYTKSDGSLAKGEWLNLEYDGHTYWYYFDDSTIMQTNWFDYNGSRYFLVPEMDGWRGRMATGWHMVDNKWYYFEPTIGANQGILYRGMTTPDGHTVGADGAWDGNGTTPVGAIHTGTTVTMN